MDDLQGQRWEKLKAMTPGDADALVTFEDKLIRQTGWPRPFARAAIDEYRKYLLLAATAGHPVSPSPVVDEVWHLHLLYTRHYWDVLCPDLLGFNLHHEPATGAAADRTKLDDWYAQTLASYRTIFKTAPPPDLWPAMPSSGQFLRVDAGRSIVLPRRAMTAAVVAGGVLFVALIGAVIWMSILLSGRTHG